MNRAQDSTKEPEYCSFQVDASKAGLRLDTFLAASTPLSRTRLQKLIAESQVTVNGKPAAPRLILRENDSVSLLVPPPIPAAPEAQDIPIDIVYQDDDFLVVNKAAGMVVHPGIGVHDGTLVNALLSLPGSISSIGGVERPGIVHRLDRDTSGLMLVAKNDFTHQALAEMLAEHSITRHYLAIALRRFRENQGVVDIPIARHPANRTRMTVVEDESLPARHARTHWRILEDFDNFSLIECRLETGRTHQIRVHMEAIGHPLAGDRLYGGTRELAIQLCDPRAGTLRHAMRQVERQMLHSHYLKLEHPRTGKTLEFQCRPPEDFITLLTALREEAASRKKRETR